MQFTVTPHKTPAFTEFEDPFKELSKYVITVQCDQCYNKSISNYVKKKKYPHITEMVMWLGNLK